MFANRSQEEKSTRIVTMIPIKGGKQEGNGPVESAASRAIKDKHVMKQCLNISYIARDGIRTRVLLHHSPTP